ncbi:MAG: hypothetical protein LBV74_12320 [Tannerella sp.]|nr:hypothetical protein [Tannerella sp.]
MRDKETPEETIKFIESKRNWDVANQRYRNPDAENCHAPVSECDIYWRGQYLIIEHENIIHFWESDGYYCYLKQAVDLFRIDIPAKWKTIDKLISLRMAIRQTEVNLCEYVSDMLIGKKMTLQLYSQFMQLAREQDFEHHGQHTF